MTIDPEILSRAQGCLLGQLAGDSLGSLVEFQSPKTIARNYPDGVRELADGGVWDTLAGQPTDDSEMALVLARSLIAEGKYDAKKVKASYVYWLDSGPFDLGKTILTSLRGTPNPESQANGALMRISPLGIFGAGRDLEQIADWARADARLTHVHPICQQVNALFAMAIAWSIATGPRPGKLYEQIHDWATAMPVDAVVLKVINAAVEHAPADFMRHQGWVLTAFQNALYQLLRNRSLESSVVDTVGRGGDTDTNAAICGALLGAVHGRGQIPERWVQFLLNCRPIAGVSGVHRPRPEVFWPVNTLKLTKKLVTG